MTRPSWCVDEITRCRRLDYRALQFRARLCQFTNRIWRRGARDTTQGAQRPLVYGEHLLHEYFAILDLSHAEGLAAEIEAIKACTTVGQAHRLQPTLEFTRIPGGDFEDDEDELIPDDAPYACAELLRELTEEAGAEVLETVFNGPFFAIPLDREADLVNVMRSAGYEVHRDDALIASIGAEM